MLSVLYNVVAFLFRPSSSIIGFLSSQTKDGLDRLQGEASCPKIKLSIPLSSKKI
jgi:hypothetical protein